MMRSCRAAIPFVLALQVAACAASLPRAAELPAPDSGFGALIGRLSEPGGFFPSDNLVSNETSYLHVLGTMAALGVHGGAYLGVGPDQNFSYIAAVRPEIAFIIDIRRDNLLHHLLFKALFENARNRMEYLALLLGRPVPRELEPWDTASIDRIVLYLDSVPAGAESFEEAASKVHASLLRYGVPFAEPEYATIRDIHEEFYERGLDIRYSLGPRYPTYRRLLLETDLDGRQRNYLAAEESFRFVKELQRLNRVVPVVGDVAGPHALGAIGKEIAARGLRITAFYISNVEQYLMRGGAFPRYAETVARLPYDPNGVIIRSYFDRGNHPASIPGHISTQLLEPLARFVAQREAGGYHSYFDLVTRNVLPLRK
ncbi:MAG: hypothetical protein ACRELX_00205 [Longimicrobiales bacterium]